MPNIPEFQFHKGTIKAISFSIDSLKRMLFQFHKGTIKALCARKQRFHLLISIP